MLKRLELVGFKSFADKTHFNFPAAITAIVGPNGSGKSNIVDAVRWILGEQSAKSLRGGEMADVIFNGSTSRKSLGCAEVTMTFDNSRRLLATDADEVDITRRVYRSGEGEYLINHQLCRLKDIKELFLGTGAGGDAYCIIEQGRVDVLLQSSTKERRTIFEEAAGISRFKARKVETVRKLERVDQNLERLRDIMEEVAKQLRSVKLQAAKAQRYQEYSERLKEVRILLGLHEWHDLSALLQAQTAILERLRTELEERSSRTLASEAAARALERDLVKLDEEVHAQENSLGNAGQQIAAAESTLNRERALSGDLEADLAMTTKRIAGLQGRVVALASSAERAAAELQVVESQSQEQHERVHTLETDLNQTRARLAELGAQVQADKAEHLEQMRQAARFQNDLVSHKSHVDNLHRERARLLVKNQQVAHDLASLDVELAELTHADEALQSRLVTERAVLAGKQHQREQIAEQAGQKANQIAELRSERSGLASRIDVLEALERGREGLGTGVGEVLDLLGQVDPGPWRAVVGMVADLVTVRHEYAPLIDLLLGDRAQRFVVCDWALLAEAMKLRQTPLSGRVSFFPLQSNAPEPGWCGSPSVPVTVIEAGGDILAMADEVVTCDHPELAGLPAQLLGRTVIVRDLAVARALAGKHAGYRFVTVAGEVLDADGTLTTGVHHAGGGILSRKSELRELRNAMESVDQHISESERALADLREQLSALDDAITALQKQVDVLAEQSADLRFRVNQHRQQREGLHEEVTLNRREITAVEREVETLEAALAQARAQAEEAEQRVQTLQARLEAAESGIRQAELIRHERQQEFTTARVALAKIEERVSALRSKYRQIEVDLEQRQQEQAQGEQHLAAARGRLQENQRVLLEASASLAHWYLEKERADGVLAKLTAQRDVQRQERQRLVEQVQVARKEWQAQQEQAHACELGVNELRHRRDTGADRIREDYQLELAELHARALRRISEAQLSDGNEEAGAAEDLTITMPHTDLAVANEEVAELRRKLNRLGSVNLDSLQELAELQGRAATLQTQFDDLTAAKQSLQDIINAINEDSRRLFADSFSTIRGHFQELFRKLFGGGMADVVLEDENDILECGIEIIARPPGKELRSISLMSGGEKTLTAVALLLAIFRSKPSPFCILDEVDAALDEANISRYTAVLREFLDRSQFIIITHSKRTMAAADVLYGITMQESGVSKQVVIRFEDWPDDGQPRQNGSANGQHGQTPELAGR